jgi:hypothetical protein
MLKLEEKARAAGFEISNPTLTKLWRGKYPSRPEPKTLRALEWLSGVPYAEVAKLANIISAGGAPFSSKIPPDTDSLAADVQETVVDVLRRFVKMQNELDALQREVRHLRARLEAAVGEPPETGSIFLTEKDVAEGTEEYYPSVEGEHEGNPRDHSG